MAFKISGPFWQTIGLGTLAGMRSMAAPAITSHILTHHHSKALEHTPLNFLQNDKVALVLKVLAVSEFLGDKLPGTPNRIAPMGVGFRAIAGAVSGASIYKAAGGKPVAGAIIGGAAAVASTFASYFIRRGTVKKSTIIDPVIGLLEDALVFGAGAGMVNAA